jgi:transposase
VEDWAEIRRLHRSEGMPIKAIARVMGCSRSTVRAALASDGPPRYEQARTGSIVDPVELRIRELLQAYPTIPATVIAERIGWTRSIRVLRDRVAELRPVYRAPVRWPRSRRRRVVPADQLPVGFGQVRKPAQLPVLTMVTGYARWLRAVLIPSRKAEDPFAGWWQVIERPPCPTMRG